jgi:hypothetical protein
MTISFRKTKKAIDSGNPSNEQQVQLSFSENGAAEEQGETIKASIQKLLVSVVEMVELSAFGPTAPRFSR